MHGLSQSLAHKALGAVPAGDDICKHGVLLRRVVLRGGGELNEKVPLMISFQLGLLHGTWLGQQLARTSLLRWYLRWTSVNLGKKYDSPDSAALIPRFIQEYGVDTTEIEGSINDYRTLNDFFSRKLRAEARPIAEDRDASWAVMPADARTHVFESATEATQLWIKGEGFTLGRLMGGTARHMDLHNCSLVISRLAPQDYHRFHAPVEGVITGMEHMGSELYSVKPVAVRSSIDVFGLNRRVVLEMDTEQFGQVVYVIIGAVQVGSICLSVWQGQTVTKGQELGYFKYGGSTVITVFHRDRIQYDADLRLNSQQATETLVRMGASLGAAKGGMEK